MASQTNKTLQNNMNYGTTYDLYRLLDKWGKNGSTNGVTPWLLDDDLQIQAGILKVAPLSNGRKIIARRIDLENNKASTPEVQACGEVSISSWWDDAKSWIKMIPYSSSSGSFWRRSTFIT